MPEASYTVQDLLRVMARLRDPEGGCPWDLAQDFRSIVPSTLEECYELAEAIEHGDYPQGTWLRSPHLSEHTPFSEEGCLIYVKTGHLPG